MDEKTNFNSNNNINDLHIGIVYSRYNRAIIDRLLKSCINSLVIAGIQNENITLVNVPGAFEIPLATQRILKSGNFDAIITLGAIIRGETPHFEYIASECTHGIARLSLENDVPIIFGVLTVDNFEQAEQRSGSEESNKGAESALAALNMIFVMENI